MPDLEKKGKSNKSELFGRTTVKVLALNLTLDALKIKANGRKLISPSPRSPTNLLHPEEWKQQDK